MVVLRTCGVEIKSAETKLPLHESDCERESRDFEESLLLTSDIALLGRDLRDLASTVNKDWTSIWVGV